LEMVDMRDVRHIGGIVQLHHAAVAHMQAIDDRRRCRDQIEIKLALKPLLDDLEMQQAEEAAAKAEAKRGGGFRFKGEARVVEAELAKACFQLGEIGGIDREEAAEHHRLVRLEARK